MLLGMFVRLIYYSGTKACEKFSGLMLQGRLLKNIWHLSPHHQTSSTEGFHSLILKFAPKNVVFPFMGMLCRLDNFVNDLFYYFGLVKHSSHILGNG